MIEQEAVYATGAREMKMDLNRLFQEGWCIVPTTLIKAEGDRMFCIVERDVAPTLLDGSLQVEKI